MSFFRSNKIEAGIQRNSHWQLDVPMAFAEHKIKGDDKRSPSSQKDFLSGVHGGITLPNRETRVNRKS